MAKQIRSESTSPPSIEVSVQYQAISGLDEALRNTGLSAHFIVWRLLLELDLAGAHHGDTYHDFEILTGTRLFRFVGSYRIEKDDPDISFRISLIPDEQDELAHVGMSADLRRRLWPPIA